VHNNTVSTDISELPNYLPGPGFAITGAKTT
jgi:hypothetical protein